MRPLHTLDIELSAMERSGGSTWSSVGQVLYYVRASSTHLLPASHSFLWLSTALLRSSE